MGNSGTGVSKIVARVGSVGLDESKNAFLQDSFKQFGIQLGQITGNFSEVLSRQKFEACIVRLYAPDAEQILSAIRNSTSNRRMVIYGVARNTQEALRFSSYGINAIFDEPFERQNVLRVVRSTHLLVIHELRRYVRIPVVMEAMIDAGQPQPLRVITQEVSGGGMSVRCTSPFPSQETVRVSFALPGTKPIRVRAAVCWSRPEENLYGFRFDSTDDGRLDVRRWIDQYLELM